MSDQKGEPWPGVRGCEYRTECWCQGWWLGGSLALPFKRRRPTGSRGGDDVAVGAAEEDRAGDAVGGHRQQNTGVTPVFNADFDRLRMYRISFAQWSRPQIKAVFARWQLFSSYADRGRQGAPGSRIRFLKGFPADSDCRHGQIRFPVQVVAGHRFGCNDGALLDDAADHRVGNRFVTPGLIGGVGNFAKVDDGGESQLAAFAADSAACYGGSRRQFSSPLIPRLRSGNLDRKQSGRQFVFALG